MMEKSRCTACSKKEMLGHHDQKHLLVKKDITQSTGTDTWRMVDTEAVLPRL
ncbi:hypothetical protein FKM82_020330 [Ascaphus truei]